MILLLFMQIFLLVFFMCQKVFNLLEINTAKIEQSSLENPVFMVPACSTDKITLFVYDVRVLQLEELLSHAIQIVFTNLLVCDCRSGKGTAEYMTYIHNRR